MTKYRVTLTIEGAHDIHFVGNEAELREELWGGIHRSGWFGYRKLRTPEQEVLAIDIDELAGDDRLINGDRATPPEQEHLT